MIASPQETAEILAKLLLHVHRTSTPELFKHLGELGLSFTQVKALNLLRNKSFSTDAMTETPVHSLCPASQMSLAIILRFGS